MVQKLLVGQCQKGGGGGCEREIFKNYRPRARALHHHAYLVRYLRGGGSKVREREIFKNFRPQARALHRHAYLVRYLRVC